MANSCLLLSTDIFKCQTLFAAIHKFCTSLPPKNFLGGGWGAEAGGKSCFYKSFTKNLVSVGSKKRV